MERLGDRLRKSASRISLRELRLSSKKSINGHAHGRESVIGATERTILVKNGRIGLIHVKAEDYYRLPSGGMETANHTQPYHATNSTFEIPDCEVEIDPWWLQNGNSTPWIGMLRKESFGYVCTLSQRGGLTDNHTSRSQGDGFRWCSPPQAWRLMKTSEPTTEVGELVRRRDMYVLAAFLRMQTASSKQISADRRDRPSAEDGKAEDQCCDGAKRESAK